MGTRRRQPDMPEQPPSPLSLSLTYLRSAAGWSKSQLARALGLADESLISAYERGAKPLNREQLDSLVEALGHPPEVVDVLLFAHGLIFPQPQIEASSPYALSGEESRAADRAAMAAGWTAGQIAAENLRGELVRRRKEEKAEAAKQEAEVLFRGLMSVTREVRDALVDAFPDYWSWALAFRACEATVKSAPQDALVALELAEMALSIAERVQGEEGWRSRLTGYCWAHIGHARRICNDYEGADEAFAQGWEFWRKGGDSDSELLAEWRPLAMEASLRRDQRHFPVALELLDRAVASRGGNSPAALLILLLEKEHVFEQSGDIPSALAALAQAAPLLKDSEDPRLVFAFRFKTVNNLCHLERYAEAAKLLPEVREIAAEQANELDLIRVGWLTAKVAAGQGRTEEAIAGLEQVQKNFTARELAYDAALSSLDLAVLWLNAGRVAAVRELAVAMGWIFKAKGIDREALMALKLFCDAALQENATVALARQALAEIERVRRSASTTRRSREAER